MASPSASTSPQPPLHTMAPASRENRPSIVGPESPETPYPLKLEGVVTKGFGRGARFLGIPTANLPDSSLGPLHELQMTGIYYGFARVHPSPSTPLPTPALSRTPSTSYFTSTQSTSTSDAGAASESRSKSSKNNGMLSPEAIAEIPGQTAPYPPDSVPGAEEKPKRLEVQDARVWPMVMSVGWNPYFKNEKITAEVHIIHPFAHDFYGHDMSVLVLGFIRPELDYVSKEALIDDINFDVKVALNSLARPGYASFAHDPYLAESK